MNATLSRREFLNRLLRPAETALSTMTPASHSPAAAPAVAETPPAEVESPLRLPPLQQAVLDVPTTDALFRDLAACTKIHAVIPKYATRGYTAPESISLENARTRLAAGLLLGVQIRYGYDGHTWCDTLLRRPAGMTLVRIREADVTASVVGSG